MGNENEYGIAEVLFVSKAIILYLIRKLEYDIFNVLTRLLKKLLMFRYIIQCSFLLATQVMDELPLSIFRKSDTPHNNNRISLYQKPF
jgi:hypothetical protein